MHDQTKFYAKWGIILVLLSIATYSVHYLIFKDAHHLAIFLLEDIAFVFLEVLLVSLIVHRMIEVDAARRRLEKLNMVIGAFFTQVGNYLLRTCVENDPEISNYRDKLIFDKNISLQELKKKFKSVKNFDAHVNADRETLLDIRNFLMQAKDFQLRLVENPVILEHEEFSELLRSVLHLTEELISRMDIREIPDKDLEHVLNDLERCYCNLVKEWFRYVLHIQKEYPYIFSFVVRTNPFKINPCPTVN
ncbi:MAG: hypothetical protein ACQETH_00135 [Candidatus Rifleibacteriota bacterium]